MSTFLKANTVILVTFLNPFKRKSDGGAEEIKRRILALAEAGLHVRVFAITKNENTRTNDVLLPDNIEFNIYTRQLSLLSVLMFQPYPVASRYNDNLISELTAALRKPVTTLIIEGVQCKAVFDALPSELLSRVTTILRIHNIEQRYFNSMAKASERLLNKFLFKLCAFQYGFIEKQFYRRFDQLHFISNYELQLCKENFPYPEKLYWVPPLAQHSFRQHKKRQQDNNINLIFFGDLTLPVNSQCLRWFIDQVFPELREQFSCKMHIAGKGSKWLQMVGGVKIYGYLENLSEIIDQGDVFILPVMHGGGVKIKTIDALSTGIPIIGSRIAFEGIAESVCDAHFIANNKQEYHAALQKISSDISHFTQKAAVASEKFIQENGCATFVSHFNKIVGNI